VEQKCGDCHCSQRSVLALRIRLRSALRLRLEPVTAMRYPAPPVPKKMLNWLKPEPVVGSGGHATDGARAHRQLTILQIGPGAEDSAARDDRTSHTTFSLVCGDSTGGRADQVRPHDAKQVRRGGSEGSSGVRRPHHFRGGHRRLGGRRSWRPGGVGRRGRTGGPLLLPLGRTGNHSVSNCTQRRQRYFEQLVEARTETLTSHVRSAAAIMPAVHSKRPPVKRGPARRTGAADAASASRATIAERGAARLLVLHRAPDLMSATVTR
jgi:hypothetical protein